MVTGLFGDVDSALSGQSNRNYIRYSIKEDIWLNESANKILNALKETGYGIRRQDFLSIRNEVLREIQVREEYKTLERDQLIPNDLMTQKSDITMALNAQYRLAMTVIDTATGHREIVFRSIADDVHYTKREIEEFAEELFSMGGEGYEFLIEGISLREVWIKPGATLTR